MTYCDFCGKSEKDARHIISGKRADICDECVLTCVGVLMDVVNRGLNLLSGNHTKDCNSKDNSALMELMRQTDPPPQDTANE